MTTQTSSSPHFGSRFGLLSRVVLGLAVVGLLPLILAVASLIRLNQDALTDQVLRTHALAARNGAETVSNYLATLESVGRTAAGSPVVLDNPGSAATGEILRGLLAGNPDLGALMLVNEDGQIIVGSQQRNMAETVQALLQRPNNGQPQILQHSEQSWLRLAVAAREEQLGWRLEIIGGIQPIEDSLRPFELGEQAILALTDGETILAGSGGDLASFSSEALALANTRRIEGAGRYAFGDDEQLAAFSPVGDTLWFVISAQPTAIAEAVAARMRRRALGFTGLALLLAGALTAAAYGTVVRPLRQIIASQRRIAGSSAEESVHGDELGALQRSLDAIEERLRDQTELGEIFLDRYQVIELIGKGAMGTVFRGWDPKLERPVALKTVRLESDLAEGERHRLAERLMREAVMTARLNHPHIVAIFDVAEASDATYIAMEFVEGITLEQLLRRNRAGMTADQVAPLIEAVAKALDAAHRNGIIHHDVKPSNVLLAFDGAIKVVDFGIAELVSKAPKEEERLFGTPGYLPPESLMGEGYDERGDLFALGVVFYEALTGRRLFTGRNLKEVFRKTVDHPVPPPSSLSGQGWPEIDSLVLHMLDKDPRRRPKSAGWIAEQLQQICVDRKARWKAPGEELIGPAKIAKVPTRRIQTLAVDAAAPASESTRRVSE